MCHRRNALTLVLCVVFCVNVYGVYLATQYDGSACIHRPNWLSLWACLACIATSVMSLYVMRRVISGDCHSWVEDAFSYDCTNCDKCRVVVLYPGYVLYTLVLAALGTGQLVLAARCVEAPLVGTLLISYAVVLAMQYLCVLAGICAMFLCAN